VKFHCSKIKKADNFCNTFTINVQQLGAKRDGITDDWAVIEQAVVNLSISWVEVLFFSQWNLYCQESYKSKIIFGEESKYASIIKASNESLYNVYGQKYPLYNH
jgi:hypothetical protein